MTKSSHVFVPEDNILVALPLDDDDIIELRDCRVLDPTTNKPVSLLTAATYNPLVLTGTLDPLPKDKWHHYRRPADQGRAHHLKVDVILNAFGEYNDGSLGVWAAGKTGWFAIKSANDYKDLMRYMEEDVRIFYFVVDAYKDKRTTGRGRHAKSLPEYTAQEIFAKYASEVIGDAEAVLNAAERIYEHRDFLLASMIVGREVMAWSQNPLFRHLARKFPEALATARQRVRGSEGGRSVGGDDSSTTAVPKPSGNLHATTEDVIALASNTSSAKRARGRPRRTPEEPAKPARRARRGAAPEDSGSEPPVLATPDQVHGEDRADLSGSESDEEPRTAHKGKSALRPRPSKGPIKASTREDSDVEVGRPINHRTTQTAGKRKRDITPSDPRQAKRRPSHLEEDEGIDMPSSPTSSDAASGADAAETPPPAPADASEADLAIRLNHHPDSVQEDTWICALDGCMHKVYCAAQSDSQKLIKEHYKLHVYDDDERIKLVRKLQAPSLPVSHLMEKVRLQAAVEEIRPSTAARSYTGPGGILGSRVAGSRFPDPVLRRL